MPRVRCCNLYGMILFVALAGVSTAAEPSSQPSLVKSDQFTNEVTKFLQRELAAHVAEGKTLDPPQATVLGGGTGGDFTWGSFRRASTGVTALTGENVVGGVGVLEVMGERG